jgi:5-methylcytosine-specific restriction protein A
MIREALLRVLNEFEEAREEPFRDHPLATWMRTTLPQAFRDAVPEAEQFAVVASAGKGNWVKGPWVAFFDPIVTETAQKGHYVVYLFAGDSSSVTLSLNQGVTAVRNELGVAVARRVLESRAAMLAARAGDEADSLSLLRTSWSAQSLTFLCSGSSSPPLMIHVLYALLATVRSSLRSQCELALENLAL